MSERISYDDKGQLDEVITSGGAHLERMDRNSWFLVMLRNDGSGFCVWIEGKITLTEERPPRALATASAPKPQSDE